MKEIKKDISEYYSSKLIKHGATPKGVDWNGEESQIVRFSQLSKIIDGGNFSINDIGCGYGRYYEYLKDNYNEDFFYKGYDLSEEMILSGINIYGKNRNSEFNLIKDISDISKSDYSILSGIFNVKMKYNNTVWFDYIIECLIKINDKSEKGFSFNMLTKYSDKDFMREDLFYGDPLSFFDYCKQNFSRNVSLLHDYDLYEFTILVKKDKPKI